MKEGQRKYVTEADIVVDFKYSDKKENLKSLDQIVDEAAELPFY